ncbi:hypothetical protein BH23ACI1_BH23ACI1_32910 [soil metagenome]
MNARPIEHVVSSNATARLGGHAVVLALAVGLAPIPARHLPELVDRADVVVVGTVTAIVDQGRSVVEMPGRQVPARRAVAEVAIEHVLKGLAESPRIAVRFAVPDAPIGYGEVPLSQRRILFLKQTDDAYELVSPYYPTVIAGLSARPNGASPLERVISVVGGVLRDRLATTQHKREAIAVLWGLRHAASIAMLRAALQDVDRGVRLAAAAGLLAAGDISALPIAEHELTRRRSAEPEIIHNLRVAIAEGVDDEAAIPALIRLLSTDVATRRAAVSALRRTKSPAAAPGLGRGLDDIDIEIRYLAVVGLAEILDEPAWRPNMDAFRSKEIAYLTYWRTRVAGR